MNKPANNSALAVAADASTDAPDAIHTATAVERPCVLMAFVGEERPTAALRRASALSRVLDAELRVLCVLAEHTLPTNTLFPQHNLRDVMLSVEHVVRAGRASADWLQHELGSTPFEREQLKVVQGDLIAQTVAHAAEVSPTVIVIASLDNRPGRAMTELACKTQVPVLLAREQTHENTIVAATDMASAGYPVLKKAAEIGEALDAPLVVMHNINPLGLVLGSNLAWPVVAQPGDAVSTARASRLSAIAHELPVPAANVISHEVNPVEAILHEARAQDADLVVVGTRRRSWPSRLLARSVAAQVINRAKRSVLVTPLDTLLHCRPGTMGWRPGVREQ